MARSPETNDAMRTAARAAILRAATEVFSERGFSDTTLAAVARRAGVAGGLPSYYFGSKENLVAAVVDGWFESLEAIELRGTADERLAQAIDATLAGSVLTIAQQRIVLALALQPSTHPVFAAAELRNEELQRSVEGRLRQVFVDRRAADPGLEEVMFRALLEGIVVKFAIYGETMPIERARRWVYAHYGLPTPIEPLLPDLADRGRQGLRSTRPDQRA